MFGFGEQFQMSPVTVAGGESVGLGAHGNPAENCDFRLGGRALKWWAESTERAGNVTAVVQGK